MKLSDLHLGFEPQSGHEVNCNPDHSVGIFYAINLGEDAYPKCIRGKTRSDHKVKVKTPINGFLPKEIKK